LRWLRGKFPLLLSICSFCESFFLDSSARVRREKADYGGVEGLGLFDI
jgi:hypothetical protein